MYKYRHVMCVLLVALPLAASFEKFNKKPKRRTALTDLYIHAYESHPMRISSSQKPIIPLKLHQIWIGPKKLPKQYKKFAKMWEKMHPEWEYKLWTNEDLEDFCLENQKLFNEASNWGAKADIWRYEILYRYGGVYVDIDFECLKNLKPLHQQYSFYSCLIPGYEKIANGVIGSVTGHPILRHCIDGLKKVRHVSGDYYEILDKTGPLFFTQQVVNYMRGHSDDYGTVVLPSDYFFPMSSKLRFDYRKGQLSRDDLLARVKPVTYAIHYWANTWQDK